MSRRAILGLVVVAATACGGDDGGEKGKGGAGGEGGDPAAGCIQSTCTPHFRFTVEAICVDDECIDVGLLNERGEQRLSSNRVQYTYPNDVANYTVESWATTVFHPIRPDGTTLDCKTLLALEPKLRRNAGYTNVVGWNASSASFVSGSTALPTSVNRVPVNEPGVEYLILGELFSGKIDSTTRENSGSVIADGCIDGVVLTEGEFTTDVTDERFQFWVQLGMATQR